MANSYGLLDFDWDAPVPDETRDRLFDKIIGVIRRWKLEVPAALFLESVAPLSPMAGQGLVAFSPFVAPWLPGGIHGVQQLQKILAAPRNVHILIDRICDADQKVPS